MLTCIFVSFAARCIKQFLDSNQLISLNIIQLLNSPARPVNNYRINICIHSKAIMESLMILSPVMNTTILHPHLGHTSRIDIDHCPNSITV
jgi:hypothetical protein